MKRNGLKYLAFAILPSMIFIGTPAWAELDLFGGRAAAAGLLDAAVQQKDVDGSDEKFQEYRDVEDGFVLNDFRLHLDDKDTPNYIDLKIKDALQEDEYYRLTTGRHGRYRFILEYDAIPHNFSGGSFLWNGFGNGRLQIADVVQSTLESEEILASERPTGTGGKAQITDADNDADGIGQDEEIQAIVNGLYDAANGVKFSIERRRTGASIEIDLAEYVKAWLRVQNENRDGARVITAGTYERFDQVDATGLHIRDDFLPSGAETAEPIDYRTLTLAAGAGIYKKEWLADIEYTFTDFNNSNDSLLWDNPFRLTDAFSTPGKDRGRFEVGQLVLPPDSQSHDVTVSGSASLPLHGRLIGSLSYGVITQDESFEPYTRNSAINNVTTTSDVDDPQNVGVADVTSAASLPAGDLDGEVTNIAASLVYTVRPVDPVSVTAKYRYYDYDNDSDAIHFPGYAGYGESSFRTRKNDQGTIGAGFENEPLGYTRQNAELGIDYRVARPLTLSLEAGWEGWDYDKLRLDSLDEYSIGAGVIYRPTRTTKFKAAYKYSDRTIDDYLQGRTEENPEATGLLNYNWAERERHQANARLQTSPLETLSFGVSAAWLDEEYDGETEGGTVVDDFRFGRTEVVSVIGAIDVVFTATERLAFYADYAHEYRKEQMANSAKDDGGKATAFFGFSDNYSPVNFWNSDIREKVDTIGLGGTAQLIPARLILDVNYSLSFSTMDIQTNNPNGVSATTLANGVAQDWGKIRNRLHEVTVDLGYQFTENLKAGFRYLYEWYDLDDFAWNDMEAYMAGQSAENTTKFVFTDATYDGYEAHVGGVYLVCMF
jgi:hypothetical protein